MFLHLATTSSTMDDAARLLREGDTRTQGVIADEQTAGRGRLGRAWRTFPAPHGLAVTFILRQSVGPHLPLIAALAVHKALTHVLAPTLPLFPQARSPAVSPQPSALNRQLAIKWPNDLLLNGRKLAGILCETLPPPSPDESAPTLVGLGLNITRPRGEEVPEDFPGGFLSDILQNAGEGPFSSAVQPAATSTVSSGAGPVPLPPVAAPVPLVAAAAPLKINGLDDFLSPISLASTIHTCLQQHIDLYSLHGWTALHENYVRHCATLGQRVVWRKSAAKQEFIGIARGLNVDGHLELVAEDGAAHVIHSGEIIEYKQ